MDWRILVFYPEPDRWFSLGPTVSSSNKTDRNDITEILLKVTLSIIKPTYLHCDRFSREQNLHVIYLSDLGICCRYLGFSKSKFNK
jgi:hypothetical protein